MRNPIIDIRLKSPNSGDRKTALLVDQHKASNRERRGTLAIPDKFQIFSPTGMYLPEIYKWINIKATFVTFSHIEMEIWNKYEIETLQEIWLKCMTWIMITNNDY